MYQERNARLRAGAYGGVLGINLDAADTLLRGAGRDSLPAVSRD
jgi:hypothetical protein